MKFNSYDELINYLKDKDLSTLEFTISECGDGCDITQRQPAPVEADDTQDIQVTFESLHDKPTIDFMPGDKNVLIVEQFDHLPNTCSASKIKFNGSDIMATVCENDEGLPTVKFNVNINGQLYLEEFILSTNPLIKNTIKIQK